MADTVKIDMEQIDEESGKQISFIKGGWMGMDRNDANVLSMKIALAIAGEIADVASAKAEAEGHGPAAEALKNMRRK